MFKLLIISTMFIAFQCKAQDSLSQSIPAFIHSFSKMSDENMKYVCEFNNNKKQVVFLISKNGIENHEFKLLTRDIHPRGIFRLYACENVVRILSIDNEGRFLETVLGKSFPRTTNVPYIDIAFPKNSNSKYIDKFVEDFTNFLSSKVIQEEEKIFIYQKGG